MQSTQCKYYDMFFFFTALSPRYVGNILNFRALCGIVLFPKESTRFLKNKYWERATGSTLRIKYPDYLPHSLSNYLNFKIDKTLCKYKLLFIIVTCLIFLQLLSYSNRLLSCYNVERVAYNIFPFYFEM